MKFFLNSLTFFPKTSNLFLIFAASLVYKGKISALIFITFYVVSLNEA